MKNPRLRFTSKEKLSIMEEAIQNGLEPTLRRHNLDIELVSRWQKNFKNTRVKSSIQILESFQRELEKISKPKPQKQEMDEKEEAFLRVVASLIVECGMKKYWADNESKI